MAVADLLPEEILMRPEPASPALHDPVHDAAVISGTWTVLGDRASPMAGRLDHGRVAEWGDGQGPAMTHTGNARLLTPLPTADVWMRQHGPALA
ncbi:hypothetical protein [Streptomyces indiaensis]|uniref:Uncharacterized protein n=1 Tax=Streptomyces indiaensis TaxID=284033 RepID=A0ABN3DRH6_9ACTN